MEDDQEKQFELLRNQHLHHDDQLLKTTPHLNESSLNDCGDGTELPMKKNMVLKIKLKSSSIVSTKEYGDEEKESIVCDVCNTNLSSRKALGVHMKLHDLGSQQSQYQQHNYFNKQEDHEEENDYGDSDNDAVTWKRIRNQNKCSLTELMMTKNQEHHQQIFIDASAAATATAAVVNSNYDSLSSDNNNNDNTCRVCGRTFPSRKSLFGHMRCHPEREWRGIEPPAAATIAKNKRCSTTLSSSTISLDSRGAQKVDDQMNSTRRKRKMKTPSPTQQRFCSSQSSDFDLPRWSVTAKRGRRSLTDDTRELNNNDNTLAVDYSYEKEQENLDDEGAYDLMMLVMAAAKSESTLDKSQQDVCFNDYYCEVKEEGSKYKAGNDGREKLNCSEKMQNGDYPRGSLSLKKKKKKKRFNKVHTKESEIGYIYDRTSKVIVGDSDVEFGDEYTKSSDTTMRKKRKTMKLKDLARVAEDGGDNHKMPQMELSIAERFKCTICNKSFPSHQALGGHKSSHNNSNRIRINHPIYKSNNEELFADEDEEEEEGHNSYGLVNNDNPYISDSISKLMAAAMTNIQTHQCNVCGKIFPTGQALGGHKRHHGTSPSCSLSDVVDRTPAPPLSSSSVGSAEDFSKSNASTSTTITTNSSTTATTGGGCRVVFDFDLNELPVMED